MPNEIYASFLNPSAAYRGKPFWSWNGKLGEAELLRQIHVFKEMGFGGFFMHSRTGLITEYMGEEWFRLINRCTEEAEKLGLEAWLYDEDRWPSGSAGGLVTEDPRFRMRYIRLTVVPSESFAWRDDAVAAFVCDLDGLAFANCARIGRDTRLVERRSVLVFTVEEQAKESFYNGYTYLDTMNPQAVERYIELTHERYKQESGSQFGRTIKGVFTDEPHRGSLMDGFGLHNDAPEWLAPWTNALPERFQAKYGYDLIPHLPALFLQPDGNAIAQVKWHYTDLLQELFHDAFAKPIREWCEANDLILTGHTLHEDSLSAQTAMVGSMMRFYEHMDYPGVDVLSEGNVNFWIVKQLASAARQLGKPWLLSELYGCTGWQMPLEGHKAVGDWQALFGINLRCHHLSWYTMEGEAKRDYPASISYQSSWWQDYEQLETYFSRLGAVLSAGKPVCDLLVINPVESLWCQIYPGWSRGLSAQAPAIQKLEEQYKQTFHWLSGAQIDFDYGDEEMMSRLAHIEQAEDGTVLLVVGEAAYRTVLVTGMVTMRESTLLLLEQFAAIGGHVIVAGELPAYVDALSSAHAEHLGMLGTTTAFEKSALLAAINEASGAAVQVQATEQGKNADQIFVQLRQDDDALYAVLMNMDRVNGNDGVSVTLVSPWDGAGQLETWNCGTGERRLLPAEASGGAYTFLLDFPATGEHVVVLRRVVSNAGAGQDIDGGKDKDGIAAAGAAELPLARRYRDVASEELQGPFRYRLDEPNVCVLDLAAYELNGGERQGPFEVLQADRRIRDELGLAYRAGDMIQPWYRTKFLGESLHATTPLALTYRFQVDVMPEGPLHLAVERPERLRIAVNGHALDSKDAAGWWVDPCFVKLPLAASQLRIGWNEVTLACDFHTGIDLEAVYVLGAFGVRTNGREPSLTKLPGQLFLGGIEEQGLPFYGGTITYAMDGEQTSSAFAALADERATGVEGGRRTVLRLPSSQQAGCIRIRAGEIERILAWQPYETELGDSAAAASVSNASNESGGIEIDLVLTRRNTFGPLHQLPLHTPHYGPPNWVTEGDSFSDDYVLLPTGLIDAPRIVVQRAIQ